MENESPASDWATVAICLAFSSAAGVATYLAKLYVATIGPESIVAGAVFFAGFYSASFAISLCVSAFKHWLRWPILLASMPVVGALPEFLNGYGSYWASQLMAFVAVVMSCSALLATQYFFGNLSSRSTARKPSLQFSLSDLLALTVLCAVAVSALVAMKPTSEQSLVFANIPQYLGLTFFVSLPVPVGALFVLSKARQVKLLIFFLAISSISAAMVFIYFNWGSPIQFTVMFLTTHAAHLALLSCLRLRGVRFQAVG